MGGAIIVILTLGCVALFVLVVRASERGLEALNALYNDTGVNDHPAAKAILLIPYILLAVWVFLLRIVLIASAVMALLSFANGVRDWWHEPPQG